MPDYSAPLVSQGADELGAFATVDVDGSVFSETAVLKTAYWFTEAHYVFITKNATTGRLRVELRWKTEGTAASLGSACGEFVNQLLDNEVRQRVFAETSAVRDTLVKKAFFEAKARPVESALQRPPPTGSSESKQ